MLGNIGSILQQIATSITTGTIPIALATIAIAVVGIDATETVKAVNATAAKVENIVRRKRGIQKRRILGHLLERSGDCLSQRFRQNQP